MEGSISAGEFSSLFDEFRTSAFRLETLPAYAVDDEVESFRAYVDGDPLPNPDEMAEWTTFLRKCHSQGKSVGRVRLLAAPLTTYLRYEIEWGYVFSLAAGEDISTLTPGDAVRVLDGLPRHDFWLFDDATVIRMEYDTAGRIIDRIRMNDEQSGPYRRARDAAVQAANPLRDLLRSMRRGEGA